MSQPTAIAAETCERLPKIALPDTTITLAQAVIAGTFTPPSNGPNAAQPLTAPDRLIAARVADNRVETTSPLCPYPQVAQYTGVGSTNDAANFVCKAP